MEFELISKHFNNTRFILSNEQVQLAVGDDCALIQPDAGKQLAVSVDTLNESIHFPAGCSASWVASRALRCNLSDLAAMGAEPLAFTLALSLPDHLVKEFPQWVAEFSEQLAKDSLEFSVDLAGGDTARGALSITIQIIGQVPEGEAMLRSNAKAGDDIYVTGTLGDAAAWLDYPSNKFFTQRYAFPEPHLAFAQELRKFASSCLDISDGLYADLGHICLASQVAAKLYAENLPISDELLKLPEARQLALTGGDDYELCFTCAPEYVAELTALAAKHGVRISRVGQISEVRAEKASNASGSFAENDEANAAGLAAKEELVQVFNKGELMILERKGYEHFS